MACVGTHNNIRKLTWTCVENEWRRSRVFTPSRLPVVCSSVRFLIVKVPTVTPNPGWNVASRSRGARRLVRPLGRHAALPLDKPSPRSGGAKRTSNHVSPRTTSASAALPAVAACWCLLSVVPGFESPVLFSTTAPQGSRQRIASIAPLIARVLIHHPRIPSPHVAVCVSLFGRGSHLSRRSTDSHLPPSFLPRSTAARTVGRRLLRCVASF